jgi:polyketide synthase 5
MAVIGLAGRLPGGIDSPDLLWEALLRGEDQITAPVGASRIWHSEN